MSDDAVPIPEISHARARPNAVDTTDSMPFSRGVSLFDSIYGDSSTTDLPLPTALYALNIAAVTLTQAAMFQLARARGLEQPRRPDRQNRREFIAAMITPAVFLASVPVALFIDANTAKLTWLILVVLNPLAGVLVQRRSRVGR